MVRVPGDVAGGIRRLAGLLRRHGGAIDADLQRFYGIPLWWLAAGRLSWARLARLVHFMPDGSQSAYDADPATLWTLDRQLAAHTADLLALANWQRSGGKGAPPKRIRRAGAVEGTRYGRTDLPPREAAAILAALAPRKG